MISILTATYPKPNHETFQFNFFPGRSRHHRRLRCNERVAHSKKSCYSIECLFKSWMLREENCRAVGSRGLGLCWGPLPQKQFLTLVTFISLTLMIFLLIFLTFLRLWGEYFVTSSNTFLFAESKFKVLLCVLIKFLYFATKIKVLDFLSQKGQERNRNGNGSCSSTPLLRTSGYP